MNKRLMIALGVLALALGLAACGDDADDTTSADGGAAELAAADPEKTLTGTFEAVADGPPESDGISGTAEMTVGEAGTEAGIELTGLEPDTGYVSHVHAGGCDQPDPGGPHFAFDLNGPEMPPNEIHLPFSSDAEGSGTAEASNEQAVPDPSTRSIVVHLAEEEGHEHGEPSDEEEGHEDGEHSEEEGHEDGEHSEKEEHSDDGHSGEEGHGADDGHTGHTHAPKLACADLS